MNQYSLSKLVSVTSASCDLRKSRFATAVNVPPIRFAKLKQRGKQIGNSAVCEILETNLICCVYRTFPVKMYSRRATLQPLRKVKKS